MKTFKPTDRVTLTHFATGHKTQGTVVKYEGYDSNLRYVIRLADGTVRRVRVKASGSFIVSKGE